MEIYLVGGAVRDALLGQEVQEKDWVVVGATPKEMLKQGFKRVGKQFPVFIHPKTNEEYALARTERKTAPGYRGFEFDTSPDISIEEDLRRRDLTINAIAQAEDGTLIDPWGGQADIETRTLRHISDSFTEDPVRILRVARFAARFHGLGFKISPKTLMFMKQMVQDGEADYLVAERVWKETTKAFVTAHPSGYLKTLLQVGVLARIAPELDALLHGVAAATDKEGNPIDVYLYKAIDQVPKHLPEILLAMLSFYASRNGFSINTLGTRWKLPRRCSWMISAAEQFDEQLKSIASLSNRTLLNFLEQADAVRRRERFEDLLTAYRLSDYEGFGSEDNIKYALRALDKLEHVNFGSITEVVSGQFAKERAYKLRLKALSSL